MEQNIPCPTGMWPYSSLEEGIWHMRITINNSNKKLTTIRREKTVSLNMFAGAGGNTTLKGIYFFSVCLLLFCFAFLIIVVVFFPDAFESMHNHKCTLLV